MAANAAPQISRLTAQMLKAKAADSNALFAGLDDDEDEVDVNELVVDDMD